MVEWQLPKLQVEGSNPFARSRWRDLADAPDQFFRRPPEEHFASFDALRADETRTSVLDQCHKNGRGFKTGLSGGDRLRAVTSERYERVWDAERCEAVDRWLLPSGFVPAVPTLNTDEHSTNVLGNTKPALFRSDRDSFTFNFSE